MRLLNKDVKESFKIDKRTRNKLKNGDFLLMFAGKDNDKHKNKFLLFKVFENSSLKKIKDGVEDNGSSKRFDENSNLINLNINFKKWEWYKLTKEEAENIDATLTLLML